MPKKYQFTQIPFHVDADDGEAYIPPSHRVAKDVDIAPPSRKMIDDDDNRIPTREEIRRKMRDNFDL